MPKFSYAAHGAVEKMRLGNGLWEQLAFNTRLQVTQIGLGTSDTDTSKLKLGYTYGGTDNNGNLRTQTITPGVGQTDFVQTYTYDALNRLQTATETRGGTTPWQQTYVYDRYGNRAVNPNGSYIPRGDLTPQALTDYEAATNRLSEPYWRHDAAGNQTRDAGAQNFAYDAENRLLNVRTDGGTIYATYSYDGEDRRVSKVAGGVTTALVYNASGQLIAEYSSAAAAGTSGGTKYVTADALGSTRVVTSSTVGTVKARYDYLPFGEELPASTGAPRYGVPEYGTGEGLRQKFGGKERDAETRLDYFQARYYASTDGRFTTPDEFTGGPDELFNFADTAAENPTFYADIYNPQSLNKYQYTYNNPINLTDVDGHCPVCGVAARELLRRVAPRAVPVIKEVAKDAARRIAVEVLTELPAFIDFLRSPQTGTQKGDWSILSTGEPIDVFIDANKHPESAQHAEDAQKAGQPSELTVDRPNAKDQHKKSLKGTQPVQGKDRDEYPPAFTKEGGQGASVRPISPSDNRGAGASIGRQSAKVPNGGKIRVKVKRQPQNQDEDP